MTTLLQVLTQGLISLRLLSGTNDAPADDSGYEADDGGDDDDFEEAKQTANTMAGLKLGGSGSTTYSTNFQEVELH